MMPADEARFVLHIRTHLVLVLLLAVFIPFLDGPALAFWMIGAVVWHSLLGLEAVQAFARGLWRLKWLFLAVLLVYVWLPDQAGNGNGRDWIEAIERLTALAAIYAWVHTLVFIHPATHLASALAEGLGPLDRLHLPGSRLARRLAMLLDRAVVERDHLTALRPQQGESWLNALPRHLAGQINRVEVEAQNSPADGDNRPGDLVDIGVSPARHWGVVMAVVLLLVSSLFL